MELKEWCSCLGRLSKRMFRNVQCSRRMRGKGESTAAALEGENFSTAIFISGRISFLGGESSRRGIIQMAPPTE
jgi:hypothetical protein